MKINKKILIPMFATAMGLSLIGGVGGAVAWYQYNTKVTGSWMGVSTADGGVLQIKDKDGKFKRDASYGASTDKLHPITFGGLEANAALPAKAYKHPEAGVKNMTSWDEAAATDYVTFDVVLKALKLNNSTGEYEPTGADVYLDEMVIESATTGKTDVGNAVRVHISDGSAHKIYSKTGADTATHGYLDLEKDDDAADDVNGGYIWEYDNTKIDYGDDGTLKSNAIPAANAEPAKIFTIGSSGTITLHVTIWLEGWEQLRGSSIWDATKDSGATIHFGMKLSTPKSTFLADL